MSTAPAMPASPRLGVSCRSCIACCCSLEVTLTAFDDVPVHLTEPDGYGGERMARLGDGLCAALDRQTFDCRIYAERPFACRGTSAAVTNGIRH